MNQTEKGKGITMGKQGDLWDDSALINAFDHAISTYKKMHGRESNDGSAYKGEGMSSNGDQVLDGVGGNVEARSQGDANKESNYASNTATEVEQSSNLTPVCVDSHVHESFPQGAHDVPNGNSYSLGAEDYNQLLNQYYEIEEKRQKILEQLHQYGSWNYQCSGEGSGYGSTFQEHSLPENQTSNANVICSCCPYACQCLVASCTSAPACCLGRSYACNSCTVASMPTDPGKSFPLENSDIVKTAMGAAERAISSMVLKTSGDSNADLENKEREKENKEGVMDESTSSETDLTILLNAWYSAGFYTGKYLVEQSIAKRRQS